MNAKYIKTAEIQLYTSNSSSNEMNDADFTIECDVDFAISLQREDIFWISNEHTVKMFPYLRITKKYLSKMPDNWYVVVSRRLILGNILEIQLEAVSQKGGNEIKEKFAHLF